MWSIWRNPYLYMAVYIPFVFAFFSIFLLLASDDLIHSLYEAANGLGMGDFLLSIHRTRVLYDYMLPIRDVSYIERVMMLYAAVYIFWPLSTLLLFPWVHRYLVAYSKTNPIWQQPIPKDAKKKILAGEIIAIISFLAYQKDIWFGSSGSMERVLWTINTIQNFEWGFFDIPLKLSCSAGALQLIHVIRYRKWVSNNLLSGRR